MSTYCCSDMQKAVDTIKSCVTLLRYEGAQPLRYKVEEVRIDSKTKDSLDLGVK